MTRSLRNLLLGALLGSWAAGLAAQAILTCGDADNNVVFFPTPETGLPNPVQTSAYPGGVPQGLAWFDPDHALVASSGPFPAVEVLELSTSSTIATIPTSGKYTGLGTIAVSPSQEYALATDGQSQAVTVIEAPFNACSVVRNVPVPNSYPGLTFQTESIAFDSTGRAFVVDNGGGVLVLDPPYTSVAFEIPQSEPSTLALSPDGTKLIVSQYTAGFVSKELKIYTAPFSAASTPVTLTLPDIAEISGIAFTPDGSKLLVVDAQLDAKFFVVSAPFNASSNVQGITIDTTAQYLEDVGVSDDGQLAILSGGGNGTYAYFVQAPFTTAGATVFKVPVAVGRGYGCARFRNTDVSVATVSPTSGPATGGTAIQATGSTFLAGAALQIGATPATGVSVPDANTIDGTTAAVAPGALYGVRVVNPGGHLGTLAKGWLADFLDVPQADGFHSYVERLVRFGVSVGCGAGNYCRNNSVTRAQMAVFMLKSKFGQCHTPPACTGIFQDVPCTPGVGFSDWIEELYGQGITSGCGTGPLLYCPSSPVTRGQMAVFLLRGEHGSSYAPPSCTGVFQDVPCTPGVGFSDWIERLYAESITGGCASSPLRYCPDNPALRGQMAVFLVKTFALP